MIDQKTLDQMRQAPIEDRLQIIEIIFQSLKNDIRPQRQLNRFKVRKFKLGQEIHVDREALYSERE